MKRKRRRKYLPQSSPVVAESKYQLFLRGLGLKQFNSSEDEEMDRIDVKKKNMAGTSTIFIK